MGTEKTTLTTLSIDAFGLILCHLDLSGIVQLHGSGDRNLIVRLRTQSTCHQLRLVSTIPQCLTHTLSKISLIPSASRLSFIDHDFLENMPPFHIADYAGALSNLKVEPKELNVVAMDGMTLAKRLSANKTVLSSLDSLTLFSHWMGDLDFISQNLVNLTSLNLFSRRVFTTNFIKVSILPNLKNLSLPTCARLIFNPSQVSLPNLVSFDILPYCTFDMVTNSPEDEQRAREIAIYPFPPFYALLPPSITFFNHEDIHKVAGALPWWHNLHTYTQKNTNSTFLFPPHLTDFTITGDSSTPFPWANLFNALPKSLVRMDISPLHESEVPNLKQFSRLTELRMPCTGKLLLGEILPTSLTFLRNSRRETHDLTNILNLPPHVMMHTMESNQTFHCRVPQMLRALEPKLEGIEWMNLAEALKLDLPSILDYMVSIYSPFQGEFLAYQHISTIVEHRATKVARWILNRQKFGLSPPTSVYSSFGGPNESSEHPSTISEEHILREKTLRQDEKILILRMCLRVYTPAFAPPVQRLLNAKVDCLPYLVVALGSEHHLKSSAPDYVPSLIGSLVSNNQVPSLKWVLDHLWSKVRGSTFNSTKTWLQSCFPHPGASIRFDLATLMSNWNGPQFDPNLEVLAFVLRESSEKTNSPVVSSYDSLSTVSEGSPDAVSSVPLLKWVATVPSSLEKPFQEKINKFSSESLSLFINAFHRLSTQYNHLVCEEGLWSRLLSLFLTFDQQIPLSHFKTFQSVGTPFHRIRYGTNLEPLARKLAVSPDWPLLEYLLQTPGVVFSQRNGDKHSVLDVLNLHFPLSELVGEFPNKEVIDRYPGESNPKPMIQKVAYVVAKVKERVEQEHAFIQDFQETEKVVDKEISEFWRPLLIYQHTPHADSKGGKADWIVAITAMDTYANLSFEQLRWKTRETTNFPPHYTPTMDSKASMPPTAFKSPDEEPDVLDSFLGAPSSSPPATPTYRFGAPYAPGFGASDTPVVLGTRHTPSTPSFGTALPSFGFGASPSLPMSSSGSTGFGAPKTPSFGAFGTHTSSFGTGPPPSGFGSSSSFSKASSESQRPEFGNPPSFPTASPSQNSETKKG